MEEKSWNTLRARKVSPRPLKKARAIPFRLYIYIHCGSLFRSSMNVRQEEKVECAAEQNNYSGFSTSRLDY